MDAKSLNYIFDKFYRVEGGDVHNVKGHGLGLSYVDRILQLHGGEVEVSSELQKGSIFRLKLKHNERI
jgi:two-component system phosphate regulon sensor histidine kinase PhoR